MNISNITKDDLRKINHLLQESHLVLKKDAELELYHHKGSQYFSQVGAVFSKVVNREYCKNCGIVLPGQAYPDHYHKIKIETFFVLYGDLIVDCEEKTIVLKAGDLLSIERGQSHSFRSEHGAVFEEISTTYVKNDSIYADKIIRNTSYDERKTIIPINIFKEALKND